MAGNLALGKKEKVNSKCCHLTNVIRSTNLGTCGGERSDEEEKTGFTARNQGNVTYGVVLVLAKIPPKGGENYIDLLQKCIKEYNTKDQSEADCCLGSGFLINDVCSGFVVANEDGICLRLVRKHGEANF